MALVKVNKEKIKACQKSREAKWTLSWKKRIVESCVFCWVRPETISRGPSGQANQSWDGGIKSLGGWCEMAANLRGRGSEGRGISPVGRRLLSV
jgi:hypothetical protein